MLRVDKVNIILINVVLIIIIGCNSRDASDIKKIRDQLYEFSIKKMFRSEELTELSVDSILYRYEDEMGRWSDIRYEDASLSKWDPAEHWRRIYALAADYATNKKRLVNPDERLQQIKSAINYWIKTRPEGVYWWNAIGVPLNMGKVLVLLDDNELPKATVNALLDLMKIGIREDHYHYAGGPATGQNLLWLATVHMYVATIEKDIDGISRAFRDILKEISYSTTEGIQFDNSFHQHGKQYYSLGYGRVFTLYVAQLAQLAHQTQFEFPIDKIRLISNFILDGQQWVLYKGRGDYSAMGREISRPHLDNDLLLWAAELMSAIDLERQDEYKIFIEDYFAQNEQIKATGNKYFWHSDFMVHKQPGYYMSVKMASNRIVWSETGSDENLKGYYLGNGVTCIYRTGREYDNIFPVWDWRRLPGLLCEQDSTRLPLIEWGEGAVSTSSYVGGVSNRRNGISAYCYEKENLSAKRSWFFFDNLVVHLISDIRYVGSLKLYQTINQCLAKGPIMVSKKNKTSLFEGKFTMSEQANWVHHDSVGYFIPGDLPVHVSNEERSDSWREINASYNETVTSNVFTLGIDMGDRYFLPDSVCYYVLPNVSSSDMKKGSQMIEDVDILANNKNIQAVHHKKLSQYQVVFYQPGKIELDELFSLSASQGVLVIIEKIDDVVFDVSVASPESLHTTIKLEINAKVNCDSCEWLSEKQVTQFTFTTPKRPFSGQTMTKRVTLCE